MQIKIHVYLSSLFLFLTFVTSSLFGDTFRVTNTDDSGVGSLRWAIDQVNASSSTDNTISFDNTLADQTITWGDNPPIIQNSVTIDGSAASGLTISGGDNHRVFFVDAAGGSVKINDLTISNGSATGGTGGGGNAAGGGGGLGAGGGLFVNQGAVTVERVSFSNNSATGGAGGSATGRSGISNSTSNPLNGGGVGGGGGGLQGTGGNNSRSDRRGGTGGGGFYGSGGQSDGSGGGGFGGDGAQRVSSLRGGGGGGFVNDGQGGAGSDGARAGFFDESEGKFDPMPESGVETGGGGAGGLRGDTGNFVAPGGAGGLYGGGGGAGGGSNTQAGSGGRFGGGGGGAATITGDQNIFSGGGSGGEFGGGGGTETGVIVAGSENVLNNTAGNGGFGGGGGAGYVGGDGGFGAGGGATTLETTTPNSSNPPVDEGVGGRFGGDGGLTVEVTIDGAEHTEYQGGGGGGGAGLGGAIFVREENGASLELIDVTESNSSVTGGQGGSGFGAGTDGQDGQAHGSGLFLGGGATTLRVTDGEEDFMTGTIAESQASSLVKEGAGNLALTGNNTFTGGVTINDGTLTLFSPSGGSGDIRLNGGALGYFNNQDIDNDIVLQQDGVLNLGGGIGARVVQSGDISESGGSYNLTKTGDGTLFLEGELTYTGRTYVDEGTLNVSNATLNGQQFNAIAVEEGRVIGGADGVVGFVEADEFYTSQTAVQAGRFSGMVVDEGGTFINGSNFTISGDLINDGFVNLTGSFLTVNRIVNNGTLQGAANIIVAASGAMNAIENNGFIGLTSNSFITGAVNNSSDGIILIAGESTTFFDNVTNDGRISVSLGGTVTFLGDFTGSGDFTGAGQTFFGGTFSPGNSPGEVTFEGDVGFQNDSVLEIELAGLGAGEFDTLIIDGNLVLDGTLELAYLDGFVAAPGDTFLVISSSNYTGTFDSVLFPDQQGWLIDYSLDGIGVSVVPEPGVYALLVAFMVFGLSILRRYRRSE